MFDDIQEGAKFIEDVIGTYQITQPKEALSKKQRDFYEHRDYRIDVVFTRLAMHEGLLGTDLSSRIKEINLPDLSFFR